MKDALGIKEMIRILRTPYLAPKGQSGSAVMEACLYGVLSIVSWIMTFMNIQHGYYLMAGSTTILIIGFLVATVLGFWGNERAASIIASCMIVFIFSIYAITGSNDGFAILWIMLIPVFCMGSTGLQFGFFASLYFQIFLIVLFYTPCRQYVQTYYTETFMGRFPILYFADFIMTCIFMAHRHIVRVRQLWYEDDLNKAVEDERERVATVSLQTIMSISNAVDAKDKYTQQHSQRVSEYSCIIAEALGWDEEKVEELRQIALLHDIGKIAVSDTILNKPGKLTDEEFAIMKSHAVAGSEILRDLTILPNVTLGAKYHHERYDGKGYPTGICGEDIPIEARIIGLADAFDAMNSNRVYRNRLTKDVIVEELKKGRGTQFDPKLIDVFMPIAIDIMDDFDDSDDV
ncbi:MAG: HD domain-containing protein [Lachnospiraceae bacterium]|nr:HD domain-containing protein [Candidatus Colinaster equi]